jgi:HAD superfamily hydrolase (TIGR01490 family)
MKIAAFFDLDGTLLTAPSLERRFFWFALRQRKIQMPSMVHWMRNSAVFAAAAVRNGMPAKFVAIDSNKSWTAGIPESLAIVWAQKNARSLRFYESVHDRIDWHLAQQHKIILVSGSLAPVIRAAARFNSTLAKCEICATELESREGFWTGRTLGVAVCGPEKSRSAARIAARTEIDLSKSFAYGNSGADRWILAAVGNPFAVNPDRKLARLASVYRWPILDWDFDAALPRLCQSIAPPHPIFREFEGRKLPWV